MAQPDTSGPYVGPEPFTEQRAAYFFGRDLDVHIIASNLNTSPATVLYGPSGVGKSSLLRAALVPYIKAQSLAAAALFREWNSSSFLSDLKKECVRAASAYAGRELHADLSLPFDELLRTLIEQFGVRMLLVFDQFEEYLLYHTGSQTGLEFEIQLARAMNRRDIDAGFLFSLREDSLSGLDRLRDRMPVVLANTLRLDHLDYPAARDAIRLPLETYSKAQPEASAVEIEEELVTAVLSESHLPQAPGLVEMALVQLVMKKLWEKEVTNGSRVLRLSTFRELGGARAIGRAYLEDVMNQLAPEEQEIACRVFVHLVTPSGAKIAQKTEDLAAHADFPFEKVSSVLWKLASHHILSRIERPERYEIFHDVLARGILSWRIGYLQRMSAREAERRAARRTRKIVGAMAAALVIGAILVAIWFTWEKKQDRLMASRELAADAINQLQTGSIARGVSLALEAAALTSPPTIDAESALHLAVEDWSLRDVWPAHAKAVTRMSMSAGARRWLATASEDGAVKVWDASSHADVATLGVGSEVWSVAFSPRGTLLASGAADGTAKIWNLETREALFTVKAHEGRVSSLAFDPAGETLATGGADGAVQLWSASTGKSIRKRVDAHLQPITAIAFSPDGRLLVTASMETIARIWALSPGRRDLTLIGDLTGHRDQVTSIAFSPTGTRIATGSADGTARLWQTSSREQILMFSGHTGTVSDVAFDPRGTRLATAGLDQTVRIWDIARGAELARLVHGENVNSVVFDPDANLFTGASTGKVRKWSEPFLITRREDAVYGVAFGGDGKQVGVAGFDAQILDVNGRPIAPPMRHPGIVTAVAFSPDQKQVATASLDGYARLWARNSSPVLLRHDDQVMDVAFHPDGRRLATVSFDKTARIWETATGREIQRITDTGKLKDVTFSRDGKLLATACVEGQAKIWDPETGRQLLAISGHEKIFSVAFDPEGRRIATGAEDGTLKLWNAVSGAPLGSYYGHRGPIYRIVFAPDGNRFASAGSDGVVRLWRPGLSSELMSLHGHTGPIFSIAFSPDGSTLLSGGDDQTARLFPLGIRELRALARMRILP